MPGLLTVAAGRPSSVGLFRSDTETRRLLPLLISVPRAVRSGEGASPIPSGVREFYPGNCFYNVSLNPCILVHFRDMYTLHICIANILIFDTYIHLVIS